MPETLSLTRTPSARTPKATAAQLRTTRPPSTSARRTSTSRSNPSSRARPPRVDRRGEPSRGRGAQAQPGRADCRPLVHPDSSHRVDRRKQAKWPETADQPGLEHFIRLLNRKHKWPLAGLLRADARTRTEDPFITSYGPLSLSVTVSHRRSLVARNPLDRRGLTVTHDDKRVDPW